MPLLMVATLVEPVWEPRKRGEILKFRVRGKMCLAIAQILKF